MAAQLAEQVTVVAAAGTEGGGAALDQVLLTVAKKLS